MKAKKVKKEEIIPRFRLRLTLILVCLAITWPITSVMAKDFYSDSKRGWFWFETKAKNKNKGESYKENQNRDLHDSSSFDALREFSEKIETAKAAMIMSPSVFNTREYILLQNEMFLKASNVMKNWQAALLLYPELNIVKNLPISQVGANITREIEQAQTQKALKAFARQYQLLFFYKSDCSYCHKFALVLDHFCKKYNAKVLSITVDGKKLDGFPPIYNEELIRNLGITSYPSLFAFSPVSKAVFPIAHGFLPIDLLERNVLFANTQIEQETNKRY